MPTQLLDQIQNPQSAMYHVGYMAALNLVGFRAKALNLVGFRAKALNLVGFRAKALNLAWFRAHSNLI